MLRTSELEYDLPESAIATRPAERRDFARLMVVGRSLAAAAEHRTVADLGAYLRPGDLLVFNTTRVLPARLIGSRRDTGGRVEGLYLGLAPAAQGDTVRWRVLLKAKRLKVGCTVDLERPSGDTGASLTLESDGQDGPGSWIARVEAASGPATAALEAVGRTPLPPYILGARKRAGLEIPDTEDRARYQTVYARDEQAESVAAPTAGLHFTPELLSRLAASGVERAEVCLHVGTGTFRPVETETVEQHPMHAEWFCVPIATSRAIARCRERNGRVVAIGTTAARALEASATLTEDAAAAGAWTSILITPGYTWQRVDALLTNFHLPRSTLMAMVAAMLEGGPSRLRELYAAAVGLGYRFYSYGDAMLILP